MSDILPNNPFLPKLQDQKWRLSNFYCIIPETPVDGKTIIPFKLREAQEELLDNLHNRVIINKCRKIGYSTLLALLCLDNCLFNKNYKASVLDYKEVSAYDKLEMLKIAWHNSEDHAENQAVRAMWKYIKQRLTLVSESKGELRWSNGSSFSASTTTMGSSPNLLWISELGPLSVHAPDRAAKIKRGSLNSVAPDAQLIIESTAEGAHGVFYDLLQLGLESLGKDNLEKTEYKLIFKPWQLHPSYKIDNAKPELIEESTQKYAEELKKSHNIDFTTDQLLWYQIKRKEIGEDIFSQFPSTFEESVMTSSTGAIYPQIISLKTQGRVKEVDYEPEYPLYTAWDLGISDTTVGILFQECGRDIIIHDSWSTTGVGCEHVAKRISDWEREYNNNISKNFLPHDSNRRDLGSGKTYVEQLCNAGVFRKSVVVLPQTQSVWNGIRHWRQLFPRLWIHPRTNKHYTGIDSITLPSLMDCLVNYRKNEKTGQPLHDLYSHGADAFRYIAEAHLLGLFHGTNADIQRAKIRRSTTQSGDFVMS